VSVVEKKDEYSHESRPIVRPFFFRFFFWLETSVVEKKDEYSHETRPIVRPFFFGDFFW